MKVLALIRNTPKKKIYGILNSDSETNLSSHLEHYMTGGF